MRTWIGILSSYPGDRPTSPSQDGHLLLPEALLQWLSREGLADPEDLSRSFDDFIEARFLHALNYCMLLPGWFFSKAALVTFGGAYAVLPYVAHSKQRKRIGSRSWSPQAPSAA